MEWLADGLGITREAAWLLTGVAVAQLAFQAACLVDLARRRPPEVGGKALWAVVVLLGSTLGCAAYLTLGRGPARGGDEEAGHVPAWSAVSAHAAPAEPTRTAVDLLYGGTAEQAGVAGGVGAGGNAGGAARTPGVEGGRS